MVGELRQPEIQHLDRTVGSHLDVGRLEIAVDDPLLVRRFEGLGDLLRDRPRLVYRDRTLPDSIGQRRPLDQFQDQRGYAAGLFQPVDAADVWVIQRRERSRFPLESSDPLRISEEGVRKDLDRHIATKLRVVRSVDLTHAAGPEGGEDLVRADTGADLKEHVRESQERNVM